MSEKTLLVLKQQHPSEPETPSLQAEAPRPVLPQISPAGWEAWDGVWMGQLQRTCQRLVP